MNDTPIAELTGEIVGEDWPDLPSFLQRIRGTEPDRIIRPEARAAIGAASAAGKKLAILSNERDLFYGADFREKLPLLGKFDLIIDATCTKTLKPDPRAYAAITDGLGINAQDCVFVDDQRKNYAGALDFNMTGVHFDVKNPLTSYNKALVHLGLDLL